MKSFIISSFGIENCKYIEEPVPRAMAGDVLVNVKAISLNYRDILLIKGYYDSKIKLPMRVLSDMAGEIYTVDHGSFNFDGKEKVINILGSNWLEKGFSILTMQKIFGACQNGVATQYLIFDEQSLVKLSGFFSYEESSTFTTSATTAWRALITEGKIDKDSVVFIPGTSSVSLFALQIANAVGAEVIITSRSNLKLVKCKQLGATHVINSSDVYDWDKEVMRITNGKGVDIALEIGGRDSFQKSLAITKPGGTIAFIGGMSGLKGEYDLTPIIIKKLSVIGIYVGSRQDTIQMIDFFEKHKIRPIIDRVFPFDQIPKALNYLEKEDHFGKIVISLENK